MPDAGIFQGFSQDTARFYRDLVFNNNKEWFDDNRGLYDEKVLRPARLFVAAMGDRLVSIAPGINADSRINKSIFRINRDTRFSRDKTPYKTHLGIWFWEGSGRRMDHSGFYFHVEPPNLRLGTGIYCFPRHLLTPYREAVDGAKTGARLENAIEKVMAAGDYKLGGSHYKRVPRRYPQDHPRGELLRHNGLTASVHRPIPKEFTSPELVDYCFEHFRAMLPIHEWLKDLNRDL